MYICDFSKLLICYYIYYEKDEVLRQVIIMDEDLGAILFRIHNEFKNMIFILKCMYDKAVEANDLTRRSSVIGLL